MRRNVLFVVLTVFGLLISLVGCAQTPAPTPTAVPPKPTEAPKPAAAPTTAPAAPTATSAPKPTAMPATPTVAAKSSGPAVTVRLGYIGNMSDAPVAIAQAKGYFKDAGLNVETVQFNTLAQQVPLLGTGQLEVGGGAMNPGVFNAVARGVDMKIVMDKSSMVPGRSLQDVVVRKDLEGQIKNWADLKGRTVGTSALGSATEVQLTELLKKGNLKFEDIKHQVLTFPDILTAMSNKAIDAAIAIEPFTTQGVEKGLIVRWRGIDEVYPNHQVGVMVYGSHFPKNNPDAANGFVTAVLRGIRDYNDAFVKNKNKAEIISILSKSIDVKDPVMYEKMRLLGVSNNGLVNLKSLEYDQEYYLSKNHVQQKLDVSTLVDNRYVENALKALGKYDY